MSHLTQPKVPLNHSKDYDIRESFYKEYPVYRKRLQYDTMGSIYYLNINNTWVLCKDIDATLENYRIRNIANRLTKDLHEFNLIFKNFFKQKLMSTKKTVSNTTSSAKVTPVNNRVIETSLINKEETFRMLALAEATGLPVLLIGEPGVGKTKTVIEYAKAWLNKNNNMTAEDFANKIYILETDEGTKPSEIKGIN